MLYLCCRMSYSRFGPGEEDVCAENGRQADASRAPAFSIAACLPAWRLPEHGPTHLHRRRKPSRAAIASREIPVDSDQHNPVQPGPVQLTGDF